MRATFLAVLSLLAASVTAEEYGVLVTVTGDAPVAVPFLKCDRNKRDIATETAPAVCRGRESRDPGDSFYAETARVTNLGDTIVWVHVGEDRLPVLPKSVYNAWGTSKFRRIFLSANPDETARVHVFASDPLQHDRFPEQRENDRRR